MSVDFRYSELCEKMIKSFVDDYLKSHPEAKLRMKYDELVEVIKTELMTNIEQKVRQTIEEALDENDIWENTDSEDEGGIVTRPFTWFYCGNKRFKCTHDLDKLIIDKPTYDKLWNEVEEWIQDIVLNMISEIKRRYFQGSNHVLNINGLMIKYNDVIAYGKRERFIDIRVSYKLGFTIVVYLKRDEWIDFKPGVEGYGSEYFHMDIEIEFPDKFVKEQIIDGD